MPDFKPKDIWKKTLSQLSEQDIDPGQTYIAPEFESLEKTYSEQLQLHMSSILKLRRPWPDEVSEKDSTTSGKDAEAPTQRKKLFADVPNAQALSPSVRPRKVDSASQSEEREAESDARKQQGVPEPSEAPEPHTILESVEKHHSGYRIQDEIAQGGMATIYRATQASLQREVALKRAHEKDGVGERFILEALITGNLEHPNIVPVHDLVVLEEEEFALAMKLIGGMSWDRLLHPRTPEEKARASSCDLEFHIDVLLQVCNAVAFAHSRMISHNDLKPDNVMVGEFGEVYLMDWGLALDINPTPHPDSFAPHRSTVNGYVFGTPRYISPEQVEGRGQEIGPWTDIYMLGGMLYEIVTRLPPHRGETLHEILFSACSGLPPYYPESVPHTLRQICNRAMSLQPDDRYQDVASFRHELRSFLRHRESTAITEESQKTLQQCQQALQPPDTSSTQSLDKENRNKLYGDFAEALAGFRQAQILWDENIEAKEGEQNTRFAFAKLALQFEDIGLAETQATQLGQSEAGEKLRREVENAKQKREQAKKTATTQKNILVVAVALALLSVAAAFWINSQAKRRALRSARVAKERLLNIQRLADVRKLADYKLEKQSLWPAVPEKVPHMRRWLRKANALLSRLPGHQRSLSQLRKLSGKKQTQGWTFSTAAIQWEHDTLVNLVRELQGFESMHIAQVKKRLHFARHVKEWTLTRYQNEWRDAIRSIADPSKSPAYKGLTIKPQLGLIPLRQDPGSGLWEFVHLQSGSLPRYDKGTKKFVLTEKMGIVLVLLPGGTFTMGARPPSKQHPLGSPNVDPYARTSEGPVHTVTLAPFFLSKYEMTQGQWLRTTGNNPSAYVPGRVLGKRQHTLLHPVEQVRWKKVQQTLKRLALTLPTEAQWEYAARAGTQTVWWTGNRKRSMQGAVNLADKYCKRNGGPGSWRYERWLNDGYVVHAPIGRFRPNAFGLHDMAGNVWEWCLDRYGSYRLPAAPKTGLRMVRERSPRVFRGGGFRASAVHARSADRYSLYAPEYSGYDVGVRPARPLHTSPTP